MSVQNSSTTSNSTTTLRHETPSSSAQTSQSKTSSHTTPTHHRKSHHNHHPHPHGTRGGLVAPSSSTKRPKHKSQLDLTTSTKNGDSFWCPVQAATSTKKQTVSDRERNMAWKLEAFSASYHQRSRHLPGRMMEGRSGVDMTLCSHIGAQFDDDGLATSWGGYPRMLSVEED